MALLIIPYGVLVRDAMNLVFTSATHRAGRQNGCYHDGPNWLCLLREESLFVLWNWLYDGGPAPSNLT